MLILTQKVGESISIGDNIKVTTLGRNGHKQLRIGIDAPKSIPILREGVEDKFADSISETDDLVESYISLLNEAIAERDALYDASTDDEGVMVNNESIDALKDLDSIIDRAQAALTRYENSRSG